eukprot:scpid88026/ scgid32600/ Ataxin-2; Spinocerebellar ataxia type 2 protein; Trinucleotide repeat-containing gene 13 protein
MSGRSNKRYSGRQHGGGSSAQENSALMNDKFVYDITSCIGLRTCVNLKSGEILDGVLLSYMQHKSSVVLDAVHVVPAESQDNGDAPFCPKISDIEVKTRCVPLTGIKSMSFTQTESSAESTADALLTDNQVAVRGNGSASNDFERQLQPWADDDAADMSLGGLEDTGSGSVSNGWDAEDMFRHNEKVHKVQTTFDPSLSDYTTAIDTSNPVELRKREQLAARAAREIEHGSRARRIDDTDMTEEDKFSAVQEVDDVAHVAGLTATGPSVTGSDAASISAAMADCRDIEAEAVAAAAAATATTSAAAGDAPSKASSAARAEGSESQNDVVADLRDFGEKFVLSPKSNQNVSPKRVASDDTSNSSVALSSTEVDPDQTDAQRSSGSGGGGGSGGNSNSNSSSAADTAASLASSDKTTATTTCKDSIETTNSNGGNNAADANGGDDAKSSSDAGVVAAAAAVATTGSTTSDKTTDESTAAAAAEPEIVARGVSNTSSTTSVAASSSNTSLDSKKRSGLNPNASVFVPTRPPCNPVMDAALREASSSKVPESTTSQQPASSSSQLPSSNQQQRQQSIGGNTSATTSNSSIASSASSTGRSSQHQHAASAAAGAHHPQH